MDHIKLTCEGLK